MNVQQPYQFPWRPGNVIDLLVDGHVFFPSMLESISKAEKLVCLEMYLIQSSKLANQFIDALTAASKRGVDVRLLLDAFGSLGLAKSDLRRLRDAGAEVRFYNLLRWKPPLRNFARDHRKLLAIDGEVAYVGGVGITDDFLDTKRPERSRRETLIRVSGPVVQDWMGLFAETWAEEDGKPLPKVAASSFADPDAYQARLVYSHRLSPQEVKRSMLSEASKVRKRLWFATAYFLPSWTIRRAFRQAATHGVDVRLLLPGKTDHPSVRYAGRRYYMRLLRAGVRIYEYNERFMHAKTVLCDDWVSIGSCNFDHWELRWNLEANQEIRDPRFASQVAEMLEEDFSRSVEIDYESWMRRSRHDRFLEWLAGLIDRIVTLMSHR